MQPYRGVLIIGIIEVTIGSMTLLGNLIFVLLDLNFKQPNVLLFVITTACVSVLIGIGILKYNKAAYSLLLYFSSVILLTKFLMFAGIIELNGELEISVHHILKAPVSEFFRHTMNTLKNAISVAYHGFIIYFLLKPDVKQIFHN